MVVKPIALVVVSVLVVAAAGTGAYLAVRDNRNYAEAGVPGVATVEPALSHQDATLGVVEETEEIIGSESSAEAPIQQPAPPVASATRGLGESQTHRTAPLSAPSATPAETRPVAPAPSREDRSASSTPSSRSSVPNDGPAVDGWERAPDSSPSFDSASTPNQVALGALSSADLGVSVDPEERPRTIRELTVSADSVIGIQVETPVSTVDAEIEDDVEARVTRNVLVDSEVAIPAGTRVLGSVVLVEQTGTLKGSARLGVRFHTVVLDDIYELPIATETVYREGKERGSESAAKIGGAAIGGAILGAILGGQKGAALGSAAGAAGGTAAAMAGDGQPATLPAGSTLTVRLSRPATVMIEY